MCLGLVMKVLEIRKEEKEAICDYLGNKRKVRIDLIQELKINDYLLIHAGFAISKVPEKEALERISAIEEVDKELRGN